MATVLINGEKQNHVPYQDRGLNYGDGLFETLEYQDGKIYYWSQHYQRLRKGCEVLQIAIPDERMLLNEIAALAKPAHAVIKIVVTRGISGRGYQYDKASEPKRIVSVHQWPEAVHSYCSGINTRICQHRLVINPALSGIKHLNRLDQVIARNEWHNKQYQEGLMCDQVDNVIEGTSSNLFIIRKNEIQTAPAANCAVDGVMRNIVINTAKNLNLLVTEKLVSKKELIKADEVFVCNSIWGICPLHSCDESRYSDHSITRQVQTQVTQEKEDFVHAL